MAASTGETPAGGVERAAAEASPRPRRGWLFWGCSTMLILALCLVAWLAFWAYSLYQYTSPEPVARPVYEPKPGEVESLRARVDAFERAPPGNAGSSAQGPARLELSPDDLNSLVAGSPEGKRYSGKVHFRGEGERILADVSLPLRELGIDALSDRYLNGTVALRFGMKENRPLLTIESIVAGGKTVPASYISHVEDKNLLELSSLREVREALQGVRKLSVVDGKIVVER